VIIFYLCLPHIRLLFQNVTVFHKTKEMETAKIP